jgi:DNA-binding NarL/FixJ family response regulator
MGRPRLVIAEDYVPTQHLFLRLLTPRYDVAAVVADGRALVDAVERHRPHLALTDISMPVMSGIVAALHIKKTSPDTRLLFVSTHTEPIYIEAAFEVGGAGYLPKTFIIRELTVAIECILAGGTYDCIRKHRFLSGH